MTKGSAKFSLIYRPGLDLLQTPRIIPPWQKLKFTFMCSAPQYHLVASAAGVALAPRMLIHKADMVIHTMMLQPTIMENHAHLFNSQPMLYPVLKCCVRTLDIPSGSGKEFTAHNFMRGLVPKIVLLGMQNPEAERKYDQNPLIFSPHTLTNVTLLVDGEPLPVASGFNLDWSNNDYKFAYQELLNVAGFHNATQEAPYLMTLDAYKTDFTLFVFDLTPDSTGVYFRHLLKEGNLTLCIMFSQEHVVTLHVVLFTYYDGDIQLFPDRSINTPCCSTR